MKEKIILWIAGPLGTIARPVMSAILGVIIGLIYDQAWIVIYKIGWLKFFAVKVIAAMDPTIVQALTPAAIGAATALAIWGFVPDWIITHMRAGNKQVQRAANASGTPGSVEDDGIILKNGETVQLIKRMAYETIYPDDAANRGGDGMPETRKPLP